MKKVLGLCFILLFILTACAKNNQSQDNLLTSRSGINILQVSDETAKSIGLKTEIAEIKKINFQIKYNGIVKAIPNKTFVIASPVNGRVLKVSVEPNQVVAKGEKLAEILSQDVAQVQFDIKKELIELEGDIEDAKLNLSLTENSYSRESKLFKDGITAKKDFLEAENKYKIAQHDLSVLGKKKESINELAEKRLSILGSHIIDGSSDAGSVEIKSPVAGLLLKRAINPGEVVNAEKILFEASDLTEVYLESQIYQKDLSGVSLGRKVTFTTEATPGEVYSGEVNYISQTINPETRTISVKAKIRNPNYKLKPEMFGKMFISLADKEALVINKKAVQKVANSDIAYIKTQAGFKETRVKLGNHTDGLIEILDGLKSGQEVATEGSFWLKSELHSD